MHSKTLATLEKCLHRFADNNEAEAMSAFHKFRRLCVRQQIKPVELSLVLSAARFPIEEYVALLNRLRPAPSQRVDELLQQIERQRAEIRQLENDLRKYRDATGDDPS